MPPQVALFVYLGSMAKSALSPRVSIQSNQHSRDLLCYGVGARMMYIMLFVVPLGQADS